MDDTTTPSAVADAVAEAVQGTPVCDDGLMDEVQTLLGAKKSTDALRLLCDAVDPWVAGRVSQLQQGRLDDFLPDGIISNISQLLNESSPEAGDSTERWLKEQPGLLQAIGYSFLDDRRKDTSAETAALNRTMATKLMADMSRRHRLVPPLCQAGIGKLVLDNIAATDRSSLGFVPLQFLRNLALHRCGGVHIMMHGGVVLLLGLLSEGRLRFWTARVLAAFTYTPVVRELVWQTLDTSMDQVMVLMKMVDAQPCMEDAYWDGTALSAGTAIAFLHMTTATRFGMVNEHVDDALTRLCDRDPCFRIPHTAWDLANPLPCRGLGLVADRCIRAGVDADCTEIGAWQQLFASDSIAVHRLLAFLYRRYSTDDANVNATHRSLVKTMRNSPGVMSQVQVLALSSDSRTRELARDALLNLVGKSEAYPLDMETWLGVNHAKLAKQLSRDGFDLPLLVDESTDMEDVRASLAASKLRPDRIKYDWKEMMQKKRTAYSWADKAAAKQVRTAIEAAGLSVWMDEAVLSGGQQLFSAIDAGISGCRVVVSCVSEAYGASENCNREVLLATSRRKVIVPALVEDMDQYPPHGDMAPLLAGKVYVNVADNPERLDQLVEAVVQCVSGKLPARRLAAP